MSLLKCWCRAEKIAYTHTLLAAHQILENRQFLRNNKTYNYHMIQQLHSWAFIPENWKLLFTQSLFTNIYKKCFLGWTETRTSGKSLTAVWENRYVLAEVGVQLWSLGVIRCIHHSCLPGSSCALSMPPFSHIRRCISVPRDKIQRNPSPEAPSCPSVNTGLAATWTPALQAMTLSTRPCLYCS